MSRTYDNCFYCGDSTIGHCMVNSCMYADAKKNEANLRLQLKSAKEVVGYLATDELVEPKVWLERKERARTWLEEMGE